MIETELTIRHSEDSTLCIYNQPGKHLKREHLRLFSEEILAIANDRDLNFTDCRVLLAIIGLMKFDNVLNLSQQKLGETIGIERPNVAKSLKKLEEKGYLLRLGTEGRRIVYMFNPDVAFKARAKNYRTLKRCWDEKLIPNTRKMGIAPEADPDFYSKLEDKVTSLSKKTGIPESKVKLLLESLFEESPQRIEPEAEIIDNPIEELERIGAF